LRSDGLTMEANGDVFSRGTPTPDTDWAVALQHCVIGEEIRQLHGCRSSQRKGKRIERAG